MSKFKVGDRVRCISPGRGNGVERDVVYTVTAQGELSGDSIKVNNGGGSILSFRFELVREETSELEQLVAKANEGLKAHAIIRQKYAGEVSITFESGDVISGDIEKIDFALEFQIKPKPAFAPFTTSNGWNVKLSSNVLQIGCRVFRADTFRSMLADLIDRNASVYGMNCGNVKASKLGVVYTAGDRISSEETLPWADAEKIYEALKKAGV